jgi:hypothetical protein
MCCCNLTDKGAWRPGVDRSSSRGVLGLYNNPQQGQAGGGASDSDVDWVRAARNCELCTVRLPQPALERPNLDQAAHAQEPT